MLIKMLRNSFISGVIKRAGEKYEVQESDGKMLMGMKKAELVSGAAEEPTKPNPNPKPKAKAKAKAKAKTKAKNGK